ncbi:Voltage-dependent N-type calcium channel subunit alpha-1B [Heracleum sosnowskyi]|uniref:Voltage-dependent N-type calcium channel subunit alpha-1B n=1 Tax=Heracleum sosnowskyi TaxID=360622 RepID=A0AAD8HWN5_9APIA|nr:Voltage-dependent N-type calcium channel subunit alpha-1B [Heracleum sosnowskyi]
MVFFYVLVISLSFLFGVLLVGLVAKLCYLLWWKNHSSSAKVRNLQEHTDVVSGHEPDLEAGGNDEKNLQELNNCCGESVDIELMRLHNINGPPRFLFTIKEETEEDLESKCLNDFLASTDLTPLDSLSLKVESLDHSRNVHDFNHSFELSVDEEISKLRSSPPSKRNGCDS